MTPTLRPRTRARLFLAAAAPLWLAAPAAAETCHHYGPEPVALSGMVSSLQVSGPPGYGATPKTDAVVQVPILQISPPICVAADPAAAAGTAEAGLNAVQLVFPPSGPQFRAELTGTSFVVSGTLERASGPDQVTPVVLRVTDLQQVLAPVDQAPPR
jgi:hypothetical protein